MSTPTTKTELLKTQQNELIKSYTELDGQDRISAIYTASTDATHGQACTKVEYEYASPTSTIIIKMKESYSTWDSSWDI